MPEISRSKSYSDSFILDPLLRETASEGCSFHPFKTEELPGIYLSEDIHPFSFRTRQGDVDVRNALYYYAEPYFPSFHARHHFLYLQIICSTLWSRTFHTVRKDLSSFLLAQTFYGSGILEYGGEKYTLKEDDVFIIDCRNEHRLYPASRCEWGYRFTHFDGNAMAGYFQQIENSGNFLFHFPRESRFQDLFRKLFLIPKEDVSKQEIRANLLLTAIISELLYKISQYQTEAIPVEIKQQQEYLKEHFRENLTLDVLARQFGSSKFHMSRKFKQYTGKNMHEYIIECRIAAAQRLLRYSDMPICEIAKYVGFENENSFYRAFRQREDTSPSLYRKNESLIYTKAMFQN